MDFCPLGFGGLYCKTEVWVLWDQTFDYIFKSHFLNINRCKKKWAIRVQVL